jgi:two-component system sensor histidine kinase DesK
VLPLQFINSGGSVFFVYAAAATPYALPRKRALYALAAILAVALLAFAVSPVPFPYRWAVFVPAFIFVPLIGAIQLYQAEKERSNARLRMAQDEIEHLATIAERERIARDLHDLLGHTLSSITLKAELAHKLARKDPERAAQEMLEVERISREALLEVRMAVSGYRSRGLLAEVASAKLICEAAEVSFAFKGDPEMLSALQESALSLILREAVTNVARHAQATRCYAELMETPDGVRFEVSDDGVGKRGGEGGGLANIRERVTMLGGRLELSSGPGFRLTVSLPKERQAARARSRLSLEAT